VLLKERDWSEALLRRPFELALWICTGAGRYGRSIAALGGGDWLAFGVFGSGESGLGGGDEPERSGEKVFARGDPGIETPWDFGRLSLFQGSL
jgi:hypothetical protein